MEVIPVPVNGTLGYETIVALLFFITGFVAICASLMYCIASLCAHSSAFLSEEEGSDSEEWTVAYTVQEPVEVAPLQFVCENNLYDLISDELLPTLLRIESLLETMKDNCEVESLWNFNVVME